MITTKVLLTIFLMGLITYGTRLCPFYLMEYIKENPIVLYLGKVLPGCIMLILVLYSLRDTSFRESPHGAPELISILLITAIHVWKRSVFLSIFVGVASFSLLSSYLT